LQAQTFYDDLRAVEKQLTKMDTFLATTKQVGLLPETLRMQQRQFMVSRLTLLSLSLFYCLSVFLTETFVRGTDNIMLQLQGACTTQLR